MSKLQLERTVLHYTDLAACRSIFMSRTFQLSHYKTVRHDSAEMHAISISRIHKFYRGNLNDDISRSDIRNLNTILHNTFLTTFGKELYLSCFSRGDTDSCQMWRKDLTREVCIVFNRVCFEKHLADHLGNGAVLEHAFYRGVGEQGKRFYSALFDENIRYSTMNSHGENQLLDLFARRPDLVKDFVMMNLLAKASKHSFERESRVILIKPDINKYPRKRSPDSNRIYIEANNAFCNMCIEKIIIGPGCDQDKVAHDMRGILKDCRLENVQIIKSRHRV